MDINGRSLNNLRRAGAVTIFVSRYITFPGSKKKKANAAREKLYSEFQGISPETVHEIEIEAMEAINATTYYGRE